MVDYKLISKTIFFPKQGILAVGDLHLGYEETLLNERIVLPFHQLETTQKEVKEIINKIGRNKIKKIILLGDIKHGFGYERIESIKVRQFLNFLEEYVSKENIILIKGNHDKVELFKDRYKDYYIEDNLAFTHGDKLYLELLDKKIKTMVIGHFHPAVLIKDDTNIKREKYKAFLIGKYKNKELIAVPSFFPLLEGSEINDLYNSGKYRKDFSFLKKKDLENFNTFIIGEDDVYEFGKFKDFYS